MADILQQQRQEAEKVLQTEKYLRVKNAASQLLGKEIALQLVKPESMSKYGNYNVKEKSFMGGKVTVKAPYDAAVFDMPEDSMLAFVLSEYFYMRESSSAIERMVIFFVLLLVCCGLLAVLQNVSHFISSSGTFAKLKAAILLILPIIVVMFYLGKKKFLKSDKYAAALEFLKKIKCSDFVNETKNSFLQKHIDNLKNLKIDADLLNKAKSSQSADILPKAGLKEKEPKSPVRDMLKEREAAKADKNM